jgi:hypothetical protein
MEPQIRKIIKDIEFASTLNDVERLAWNAFKQGVRKKFLEKCNRYSLQRYCRNYVGEAEITWM